MSSKLLQKCVEKLLSRGPLPEEFPERESSDALVSVDISPSMEETDMVPDRLAAAQDAAIRFVEERRKCHMNSRIAILGFATSAVIQCGLTPTEDVSRIVDAIRTLAVDEVGTNITASLLAAESLFKSSPKNAKREIRLITDGGHNVGPDPIPVAHRLKNRGCVIHALGIGGDPSAVDEELLVRICSKDEYGKTLYRFINDRAGLMKYFEDAGGGITK